MFRFLILFVLIVGALSIPMRQQRDTDGVAAAAGNAVATADEKPDLEGRFGHGGYGGYPGGYHGGYGGGYPGGYGGGYPMHGGYPGGYGGYQGGGMSASQAQASASAQSMNMGGGGFMPYGK